MSIYYRKQNYRDMIFRKNLHLKHISEELFEVMPKNFSFKDFLLAFKECYPCQWEDIVRYCNGKKNDFYRRSRKGLRVVPYYTPEQYLKHAVHMRSLSKYLNEQDRYNQYASLVLKGQEKKGGVMRNLRQILFLFKRFVHHISNNLSNHISKRVKRLLLTSMRVI